MGVTIKINDGTDRIAKVIDKNVKDSFEDIILDLKRTSSASAPHDSGFLEKNKYRIKTSSKGLVGEVYFVSKKKGFDYAEWTHNADYNLGEKSKRKAGGKSKFASGSIPVGKAYLARTVTQSTDGYLEHIAKAYGEAIN